MTLTVCVGASGSGKKDVPLDIDVHIIKTNKQSTYQLYTHQRQRTGKTTFLNDVHKFHKCTYIRQYHNLRPYIKVAAIPNFDPTQVR